MIAGFIHAGSGCGNQLFRYVATRVAALDRGYDFGMVAAQLFKGESFMQLDMGIPVPTRYSIGEGGKVHPTEELGSWFIEKELRDEHGVDIRGYDPEINFIKDNSYIDGEFQDERYFNHRLPEVREWLKVEPIEMGEKCVICFRGGEFRYIQDLFLPNEYWNTAIDMIRKINPNVEFEVHTDDYALAKQYFPFKIIHDIGINWRSVRYAKYLILSNSSFYIFPTLLNENVQKVIAPRYWARRNTHTWALPQNFYSDKRWQYI